jgi:predicted ATPase
VPFIKLLKQKCVSISLESGHDYRLDGKLHNIQSYILRSDENADVQLDNFFKRLVASENDGEFSHSLIINLVFSCWLKDNQYPRPETDVR